MLTERHKALRFFLDHGGYWYNPNKESEFQGRWRSARTLADAEARMRAGEYWIDVTADPEPWDGEVPWDDAPGETDWARLYVNPPPVGVARVVEVSSVASFISSR